MASFSEWSNNKKSNEGMSFAAWSDRKNGITQEKTRDEFDSSVRQNYAARTAASAEPALKTAGGYYTKPTIGANEARLRNTAEVYKAPLEQKKTAMDTSFAAYQTLNTQLEDYGKRLEGLQGYEESNDDFLRKLYNNGIEKYDNMREQTQTAYDTAYAAAMDYDAAAKKYNDAVEKYTGYMTQQQDIYNAWKGTIRTDGTAIDADIAGVDGEIARLKQQQKDLNRQAQELMNKVSGRRGGTQQLMEWSAQAGDLRAQASAMDAQIQQQEQMKALLQEEKDWAQYYEYEDQRGNADFAKNSVYVSTEAPGTEKFNALSGTYTNSGFGDIAYDYINKNETAKGRQMLSDIQSNAAFLGLDNSERGEMTDEEIAMFNYLYAKDNAAGDAEHKTAWGYIDYLTKDLNYRQRAKDEEYWASFAKESPVGSSVFSVLTSPMKGLSYIGQLADYTADGKIDQNAGYNKFSYMNTAMRGQVAKTIEESGKWGKVGSFMYQTGMSMADFLFNTAITGGFAGGGKVSSAMALGIMGSGAAADTVISAKDRGLSDNQAFAIGTIAGAAEVLTEKFSIEALLEGKWEESVIKYVLKNAATEGIEEVGADVINAIADILIAKDKSEWQTAIDAYKLEHPNCTEGEALGHMLGQQALQTVLSFAGGALSGGLMASATGGINVAARNADYRKVGAAVRSMGDETIQAVIDTAMLAEEKTDTHKLAVELQGKLKAGSVTDTEIGKLLAMSMNVKENANAGEKGKEPNAIDLPTAEQAERDATNTNQENTHVNEATLPTANRLQQTAKQYGVEKDTMERVQRISDVLGRDISFYLPEDVNENGYYDGESDTIFVSARSANPVAQIIGHELTHSIERAGSYDTFRNLVRERIEASGGNVQQMVKAKQELYKRHGKTLSEDGAVREVVAEYVEKRLLTDEASIREVVQRDRNLGQRILNWLNDIIAKLGNKEAQERAMLTRMRDLYASALQETQTSFTEKTAKNTNETTRSAAGDEYMESLRAQLADGEITEEEYDRLFDEYYEGGSESEYSYGGKNANGADLESLKKAIQMEQRGVPESYIFRETGWYTGADGKWRFEIDDSGAKYNPRGDNVYRERHPDYVRYRELLDKKNRYALEMSEENLTDEERMEFEKLSNIYGGNVPKGELLEDYITHDELFRNYPQLRKTRLEFDALGDGERGYFDRSRNTIVLSNQLKNAPEDTLIHEIQHAIQAAEGFARGSSHAFWRRAVEGGFDARTTEERTKASELWDEYNTLRKEKPDFFEDMVELSQMAPDMPRGKIDFDTLEQLEPDPPEWQAYDEKLGAMEEKYGEEIYDFIDMQHRIKNAEMKAGRTASDLYRDTAGEIEARDAAKRRTWDAVKRSVTMPDTGNEDTVFVEQVYGDDTESYDIVGTTADGTEVYETSDAVKQMPVKQRQAEFLRIMKEQYRGRTAKFTANNGETYYAKFDENDLNKNIYGDKKSDKSGYKAKINTGADGSIFELVENAKHDGGKPEIGKKTQAHKSVSGWEYFVKTVQIDGKVYDLLANVRKKPDGEFVYSIQLNRNKNKAPAPPTAPAYGSENETGYASERVPTDAYGRNISQESANVKKQFSLSEPVERTGNLVAYHNMDGEKLDRSLDLGAWPAPSIAVVQTEQGHQEYGEYSAIFPRETIDPQADKRNRVYGSDAWTPTHANAPVENEIDLEKKRDFDKIIEDMSRYIGGGNFTMGSVLGRAGINEATTSTVHDIAEKIARYPDVMAAYLATQGEDIEVQHREKSYGRFGNEVLRSFVNGMPEQELAEMEVAVETRDDAAIDAAVPAVMDVLKEKFESDLRQRQAKNPEKFTEETLQKILKAKLDRVERYQIERFIQDAWEMHEDGADTNEVDKMSMLEELESKVKQRDVIDWAEDLLDGLFKGQGIYNGEEIYTDNGRRSFAETHEPVNAENVVKAMFRGNGSRGVGMFGAASGGSLVATATPEYESIDAIHADEARLRRADQKEYDDFISDLDAELNEIVSDMMETVARKRDSFQEEDVLRNAITEAGTGKKTRAAVKKVFAEYGYRIENATADALLNLYAHAAKVPTEYFESKPERVVGFEEAVAVLAPDDAPLGRIARMKVAGMNVVFYEAGNEADRLAKANELNAQFSISEEDEMPVPQQITSAKTSIKQIPALFKDKNVKFGDTNIDIGGGRFDLATNFLREFGTENMVFDPYNRGEEENRATLRFLQSGKKADTATCTNVLNVIAEPRARANVILETAKAIRKDGAAYFMVYEGDGTGKGRETSAGWQNNRKTADYVQEIEEYFDRVQRKGKLIIAESPKENLPMASWEIQPGNAVRYSISEQQDKKSIANDLRDILKSGNAIELKRYVDTLEGRETQETGADAAADIVNAAHAEGMSVDEYLRQNWERYEYDGRLNADARRALEMEKRQRGRRYSISESLKDDLERVLDSSFEASRGEVYIGETSNFLTEEIGAEALKVTMPASKAYSAMATESRAKQDGRYQDGVNYHGLGSDGLARALEASENPVAAYAATPDENGKRTNSIVLVTDEVGDTGNIAVIEAMGERSRLEDKKITANKVITSYDRRQTANDIIQAAIDGRLLHLDKKRSQAILAGRPGYNSPAAMREADFENNIHNFWANVNWEKNGHIQSETPGKTAMAEAFERAQREKQFSISEGVDRDTLTANARNYLKRTERGLLEKVSKALSVPSFAKREYLQNIVKEISDEYLKSGRVAQETIDRLFDTAYDEGIVVDDEYYKTYKHIKDHLRKQAVTISEQDRHDIADFNDFRKSAFGTLRIVNEGGLPVDVAYQELQGMAHELFPDDIIHPADQLMRMFEVARSIERAEKSLDEYYGHEAEDFRAWAKNDFNAAVSDTIGDLRAVRRYAEEKNTAPEPSLTTQAEVEEAYKNLKEARRTYEKAAAKNLLTDRDNVLVGRLLKGELNLEDIDPEKNNAKGIAAVFEARQEYERLSKLIKEWNAARRAELRNEADKYLETANDWKDKKAGILYSRETMERNILDIVKDKKLAKEVIGKYFTPVHEAQANATRLKNRMRDRVLALNLSTKETKAMQRDGRVSEAHAVQLLGEAMDNIKMLENSRGRMEMRDGKTLSDWRGIVRELWENNPQLDRAKIEGAVEEFRKIYDELFKMMNDARLRNGYEPVNYRKGYFPHFQPGGGDGIMGLFGKALDIQTGVSALPTTINGLTHTFRPGIQWFGNAQERIGFNTVYDAVEGFDRYIEGVADVIYQTDNIQRLRALATQARYRTGEEGIRKQIDAVYADQNLSEQDKQNRIDKIFETGSYALGNFVVELEEYTNLLANKKSRADRDMEQKLGRKMYNLVKALESRVAANMVAINPGSWLTNFIPLTQGGAQLNRGELLKGMWQTLRAYKTDDGFADASTFLTNRRGSDPIVRTWQQKASAAASKPMEYIDRFTSDSLVRARYNQNLKSGMSEDAAMSEADSWTAGVMADRSKGSMPTLFNRNNPLTKVFTQFQLEVNNQLSYLFKDMPREQKEKGLLALAAALFKFFFGAWLYDEVYEYFVGRRPALDPLGILNETVGDITGYELPNLVELGVGAVKGEMPSFETEKQNAYDTTVNVLKDAAEELPFIGGVLGGGRVPISSALPDWDNLLKTVTSDTWSTDKKLATAGKEMLKPASYLALPFGGGQLKKIYQGLRAVIEGGSYSVDAEGNDLLQYPVFTDNPWETAMNATRAMVFGKTSLKEGREWIESGFKNFGAKETAAYQAMTAAGVEGKEAYELLKELRMAKKSETETEAEAERSVLRASDVSGDGKSIVYYGMMATDKERELMDRLEDMGADMGEATQLLMEVKDANKESGASGLKRDALLESALTDAEKQEAYRYIFGQKQDNGTYASSRDDDIMAFRQEGMDMDDFLKVQNAYTDINDKYGRASEKATEFSRWVNEQNYSQAQAAVVRDCFKYYSQMPAEARRYDGFVAAGLKDSDAYSLANDIAALEPMDGKNSVSDEQKWRVIVDAGLNANEQIAALETVTNESQFRKLNVAYRNGVEPETYVTVRERLPKYDADGNGSYKNAEIEAALESFGGFALPGAGNIVLTNNQKAVLWQLLTGSTSAKNNPYSTSIGQKIIEEVQRMKEAGETEIPQTGIVLPRA